MLWSFAVISRMRCTSKGRYLNGRQSRLTSSAHHKAHEKRKDDLPLLFRRGSWSAGRAGPALRRCPKRALHHKIESLGVLQHSGAHVRGVHTIAVSASRVGMARPRLVHLRHDHDHSSLNGTTYHAHISRALFEIRPRLPSCWFDAWYLWREKDIILSNTFLDDWWTCDHGDLPWTLCNFFRSDVMAEMLSTLCGIIIPLTWLL